MPDLPISGLPELLTLTPSDSFAIVNSGITKKTTAQVVGNSVFNQISSSVVLTSQSSSFANATVFNNYTQSINNATSSFTTTSSFNSFTASYNNTTGSFGVTSYYGSFLHTASISLSVTNASYSASFNTTDFASGVSISGSNQDKIKIDNTGIYNIQFSAQFDKTNSANATVYVWLRKNGTNIPITNTGLTLGGGSNDASVAAWNFFVSASANDYYQLMFGATDNNVRVLYTVPPIGPAVPSIILTVNRIT
jgi:hypothetical protein